MDCLVVGEAVGCLCSKKNRGQRQHTRLTLIGTVPLKMQQLQSLSETFAWIMSIGSDSLENLSATPVVSLAGCHHRATHQRAHAGLRRWN